MQKEKKFDIVSFYKFIILDDLEKHQLAIKKFLIDRDLKGTLILSPEGLNGTVSGVEGFVKEFNQFLFKNFSFDSYDSINLSSSSNIPFDRPTVKIKKEVVPIEKNILERGGKHINPEDWNEFIKNEDIALIDIRKPFEHEIGSFQGAINPNVNSFREFKNYFDNLIKKNNKKLAIFCTGGIRCEKASEYLKEKGLDEVYQLKGGILNYINSVEEKNSLWKGECFVFDKRVSVKHKSIQGSYSVCYACRMPINDEDKKSPNYKQGVNCPRCFNKVTPDQKKRFAMREFNKNRERK